MMINKEKVIAIIKEQMSFRQDGDLGAALSEIRELPTVDLKEYITLCTLASGYMEELWNEEYERLFMKSKEVL